MIYKIYLYFEITMEHLTSARQIMASTQEKQMRIFTLLSGINQQCGNILDSKTSQQTCTCHLQTMLLRDKIVRKHNGPQEPTMIAKIASLGSLLYAVIIILAALFQQCQTEKMCMQAEIQLWCSVGRCSDLNQG